MSKIKISATIKPTLDDNAVLKNMIDSGADIIRIPFWTSAEEQLEKNIEFIQKYSDQNDKPTEILLDLPGNKIRFGSFAQDPTQFFPDTEYHLFEGQNSDNPLRLPVDFPGFASLCQIGDELICGDGEVVLRVTSKDDNSLKAKSESVATVYSKKGIAITGRDTHLLETNKGFLDYGINFASKYGIQWLALSFTSKSCQIEYMKNKLSNDTKVMAKIESQLGIDNLDDILLASDGVMIARGDLAVYVDYSMLGVLQKRIIERSKIARKFCMLSTGVMMSAMEKARPRPAEILDISNAVLDGVDAIQLCEETAHGKNPGYIIKIARKIIDTTLSNYDTHDRKHVSMLRAGIL